LEPQIFKPHSHKQNLAIHSTKPILIFAAGIQSGKSTVGAVKAKIAMHKYTRKKDNFIITAPTYKILQQATLPAFLNIMEGYGTYHKVDAMFKMHNGGTCFFRTATDPDSVVGITDVRFIWGDEAGLYSLYFHENIQARASFKQAQIVYTTSPYSLNWIYSDYIRPFHKGVKNEEVEIIQARSDENPYFPKEEFERKKRTMDPRRFNMVYGGEFHKLEGLVYSCFDEDAHVIEPIPLEKSFRIVAGVDWGYTNPAVISVIAVHGSKRYLIHEWYQTQKTITQMVDHAKRLKDLYGIERFYCDPSSPANIQEFNKAGLTAIGANNDIRPGIDAFFECISDGNFKVFSGRAPHFLDEISMYHYPTISDVKPDKDVKDQLPVKQHDHILDSVRYVIYGLKLTDIMNKRSPVIGGTKKVSNNPYDRGRLLRELQDKNYNW